MKSKFNKKNEYKSYNQDKTKKEIKTVVISIAGLFLLFLGLYTDILKTSNQNSIVVYAEESSYFENVIFNDFNGWEPGLKDNSSFYTVVLSNPSSDGSQTLNTTVRDSGYRILANKDGSFNFRRTDLVSVENNTFLTSELGTQVTKNLKKGNTYELKFNSTNISGTPKFKFRALPESIKYTDTDESNELNVYVDGKKRSYSTPWETLSDGEHSARFTAKSDDKPKIVLRNYSDTVTSEINFGSFEFSNVTPASIPRVDEFKYEGENEFFGEAYADDGIGNDRTDFSGEIVHVLKNGTEIGQVTIDESNTWKNYLPNDVVVGEVYSFFNENPDSGLKSKVVTTTIIKKPYTPEDHKLRINSPREGDNQITGTGTPGDKVLISDKDGNSIGEGTVDEAGKFEVIITRIIEEGEVITATPDTNGEKGISTDTIVIEKPYDVEENKLTINSPNEGDNQNTGTLSEKLDISDKDKYTIGEGTLYEDGKFDIMPAHQISKKEKLAIKYLPQTGSSDLLITVYIGLIMISFSIFLFWIRDNKNKIKQ